MYTLILAALSIALALGGAVFVVAIDRRAAAWSRPGDATVGMVVTVADRPSDGRTAFSVEIANPGSVPVLAGLSLRRALLPGGWKTVSVARRTTRPHYQPDRQATVAVVPPESVSLVSVLVPSDHPRYRLAIMLGQSDGRLHVIRAPVTIERPVTDLSPSTRLPAGQ
jgi:hypothetical protein